MPAVLNTNVASLWASKNLLGAQEKMANSVERLSSGLRINRARDDAAGLGIAQSLSSQINGANQGIRNINDGISMVQTAEAAISAATEMGQRILTLATQAANATFGSNERASIQNEMKRLIESIDSIGSRTKFSGNALLAVDPNSTLSTDLYKIQATNISTDTVNMKAEAFQNIGGKTSASFPTVTKQDLDSLGAGTYTIYVNVSATAGGTNNKSFDLAVDYSGGARRYRIKEDAAGSIATAGAVAGTAVTALQADGNVALGAIGGGYTVLDATKTLTGLSLGVATGRASALSTSIDAATTADTYRDVQVKAQAYVDGLVSQRGLLGAYQNQMEYTVSNITELSSNLSAAKSRVIDTDYAAETANLTKGQILQQAATAMLAQANQMPNVILTLLK
jgi:flagellin